MGTPSPAPENVGQAQSIFEKAFEYCPDAVLVSNSEGRITQCNAQMESMFGYTRADLLGQPVEVLIPERFRNIHPAHRKDYNSQPRMRAMGIGLELYGRRKDGSEFPVDIMLSSVPTANGSLVLSIIRDITRLKQTQEVLRQTEECFHLLVENARDYAIFMMNSSGHIVSWNPGAERLKGYRADEIIGRHFSCFYPQEDIDHGRPDEALREAAAQGHFESDGWRVRKDGSRFWANGVMTRIQDSKGNLIGFATVTRDFTERKQGEDALLLEMSHALLSNLDIRKLLSAISSGIRQVVPHDYASLALCDDQTNQFRVRMLDSSDEEDLATKEIVFPVEGSAVGWALETRKTLVIEEFVAERFASHPFRLYLFQYLTALGLKSGCWIPLIGQDQVIGTLVVASRRKAAFSQKDVHMLDQVANQVALAVGNALAVRQITELSDRLIQEKHYLEEELRTGFEEIVGESPVLKRVLKQVEMVASTDATVLILGETGTGKELIARCIHQISGRRERTFVRLNCSAIPSGLLESELFGHERGAFTGAVAQKLGRLELAHQGTLFLDEVGDIPLELQPKLLRAFQEKEFERLGSTRTIPVDVRLVAATNRELEKMVSEKQFRSDLYYRLKVFPIKIPPLRERRDDIPLLVRYFVHIHARRMDKRIETIPPEVMQALTRWHWPGNVRELENFIERAVILSPGPVLRAPLAELEVPSEPTSVTGATLETTERDYIIRVLKEAKGIIGGPDGAAARLGLKRTTLNSKMKKLGIERADYT